MERTATFLLLAAWLAGCSEANGGSPDPLTFLADRTACEFQYPDGSPVPCTDGTQGLAWQAQPPLGWVCESRLSSGPGGDYDLYRHLDGRRGLGYHWTEREAPYDGLVYADAGGPLYRWESPSTQGFVVLPADVVEREFVVYLAQVRLETATPALADYQARSLFTRFEGGVVGDLWHLYEIAGPGPSYYAAGIFKVVADGHESHGVAHVHLTGADHDALLTYGSNGGLLIGGARIAPCLR